MRSILGFCVTLSNVGGCQCVRGSVVFVLAERTSSQWLIVPGRDTRAGIDGMMLRYGCESVGVTAFHCTILRLPIEL